MESELYEAAVKGNVPWLLELLGKDELLLDRIMTGNRIETPLHIAAMLGHLEFVKELLARKAELAREQNSQGSTPLHLAAAKGYLNIVASLLRVETEICFVRDQYERNPLHVAAMKGHVDVLELLVRTRPDAARSVVDNCQTILHLCVKHNRLETLKLLIDVLDDDQFINSVDEYGDTILHLAAANKQTKTVLFLINKGVNPNIMNSRGFTALVLSAQGESAESASENKVSVPQTWKNHDPSGPSGCANPTVTAFHPPSGVEENDERDRRKWHNRMHQTLLVVATLLATLAYQAGITPPGGLWQASGNDTEATPPNYRVGQSIMAYELWDGYMLFVTWNTISLVAALSIILLLISGVSSKWPRITTWIAMLTMWVAVGFGALTYFSSLFLTTPGFNLWPINGWPTNGWSLDRVYGPLRYTIFAWIGLVGLVILCHLVRVIVKLVQKVREFARKSSTERKPEDHMA